MINHGNKNYIQSINSDDILVLFLFLKVQQLSVIAQILDCSPTNVFYKKEKFIKLKLINEDMKLTKIGKTIIQKSVAQANYDLILASMS